MSFFRGQAVREAVTLSAKTGHAIFIAAYVSFAIWWTVSRPEISQSALWSLDAALMPLIIAGPVLAGISAADAYVLDRGRVHELVESLPLEARLVLHAQRGSALVWLGLASAIVSAIFLTIRAAFNGSFLLDASAFLLVFPVFALTVLYVAVGRVLAILIPFAFTPVLVAAGLYGALAYLPDRFHLFFGFTAQSPVDLPRFAWREVISSSVLYLLAAIGCAAVVVAYLHGGRYLRLGSVLLASAGFAVFANAPADFFFVRDITVRAVACVEVPVGAGVTKVCLPRDQERDLDFYVEEASDVLHQANLLAPTRIPETMNYSANWDDHFGYPFGVHERGSSDMAYWVLQQLSSCQSEMEEPRVDEEGDLDAQIAIWDAQDRAGKAVVNWLNAVPDTDSVTDLRLASLREDLKVYGGCE